MEWTKQQGNAFINMLAWQGDRGPKQTNPNRPNRYSLEFASKAVDHWSGKIISLEICINKLHTLYRRYDTFKRILDDLTFSWNPRTNRVSANNDVRKR
ncbi:UNVERIFIED_CONTAM: hypothetical protein Slati_3048900 [Sesamum latifolium]|uniref:Myb/SANT-like domain-containing protein n=1 Tax=Sesamum latifolium TaxID=2727402 RepID=A0AAW2UTP8_9LAMI